MSATRRRPGIFIALLFLISIVAYADRQVIALVKPALDREFGWRPGDYGAISAYSQIAVAFSLLVSGWVVDRMGAARSLGFGLAGWSAATMLHAAMRSVMGFVFVRFALGIFEGVGTPALMRAVSEACPRERRAAVIGMLNAAPNIAAMLTPMVVSILIGAIGWRGVMLMIGAGGLLLAVLWGTLAPSRDADPPFADRAPSPSPSPAPESGIGRLVVVFATAKALTDPVWWFLLFWLPDFLVHRYGLGPQRLGLPLGIVYAMAAIGSLVGGALPGWLARHGWSLSRARRGVMGVGALCALPLPLILHLPGLVAGVVLCGSTLAAHQIFASNLFGLVAERQPERVTGRTIGAGAFCGNMAGALMLYLVGQADGHLAPVFAFCAVTYGVTWGLLLIFLPRS